MNFKYNFYYRIGINIVNYLKLKPVSRIILILYFLYNICAIIIKYWYIIFIIEKLCARDKDEEKQLRERINMHRDGSFICIDYRVPCK